MQCNLRVRACPTICVRRVTHLSRRVLCMLLACALEMQEDITLQTDQGEITQYRQLLASYFHAQQRK